MSSYYFRNVTDRKHFFPCAVQYFSRLSFTRTRMHAGGISGTIHRNFLCQKKLFSFCKTSLRTDCLVSISSCADCVKDRLKQSICFMQIHLCLIPYFSFYLLTTRRKTIKTISPEPRNFIFLLRY